MSLRRMPSVTENVVLWDFDGTLAYRDGMWRGCLVEALDEVAPGHGVIAADVKPGLRDGFPWHPARERASRAEHT